MPEIPDDEFARLHALERLLRWTAERRAARGIVDEPAQCACASFLDAATAVDNLTENLGPLPTSAEPFPPPEKGEGSLTFMLRASAAIRDLQRRVVQLECAAKGHPRPE